MNPIDEVTKERAAILEHDGELSPERLKAVMPLARKFYAHLFIGGCCSHYEGDYCPQGRKLRDEYFAELERK